MELRMLACICAILVLMPIATANATANTGSDISDVSREVICTKDGCQVVLRGYAVGEIDIVEVFTGNYTLAEWKCSATAKAEVYENLVEFKVKARGKFTVTYLLKSRTKQVEPEFFGAYSLNSLNGKSFLIYSKTKTTSKSDENFVKTDVKNKIIEEVLAYTQISDPVEKEIIRQDIIRLILLYSSNPDWLSYTTITIHFHYPEGWKAGDPLPQKDIDAIQKAKDLNAKYVRTL
jgi:Holliday junction resolvase